MGHLGNILFGVAALLFITFTGGLAEGQILVNEPFEDTNFAARGWYDGSTSPTLSTTEHIPGSQRSFECRYLAGQRGCQGGSPSRVIFTETEIFYLTYWVKYSANWQGSNRSYHPHEFYVVTNADTRYVGPANTHLTAYVEQVEGNPRLAIQDSRNVDNGCIIRNNGSFQGCNGNAATYPFTENRSVASCNGIAGFLQIKDCYNTGSYWYSARGWAADGVYFRDQPGAYYKNDWHIVEAMFQMNTIANGRGVADGKIRYWLDGNLLISSDQILLRTGANANMKFNQLILGPYIGDGSPVDQTMWIDGLVLSTTRQGAPTIQPPLPPLNLRITPIK